MKNVFAETFPSGTVKTSVTSITLVNNTAKTQDVTVPTDTKWIIETIRAVNPDDVARFINVEIWRESAKTVRIATLTGLSTGALGAIQFPNNDDLTASISNSPFVLVLGAGMTISVTWSAGGASAGGTDADGLVILYRELTLT